MTANMPLKFGQIAEFFYYFLFKMGLIGTCPLWKIIDAVTLTLITMGTYIAGGLAENNIRQANQHHSAQGGPHIAESSDFLSFQGSCRWPGLLGSYQFLGHCLHLPVGVYGTTACAAQILGSFKGFSQPLHGQSSVKSEVVVSEVDVLCE